MKITVRYNEREKIIPYGTYEDAINQLEIIFSKKIEDYELLIEDVDESMLQIMNGGLCVAIPTANNEMYCRYTGDCCVPLDLLEDAIEDFFDDDTELSYIEWDHDLDDYIPN